MGRPLHRLLRLLLLKSGGSADIMIMSTNVRMVLLQS